MKKFDLAEAVFYASLLALFLWALFKATGVINSSGWLEMVPYFSIVFAGGAFYQKFARLEIDVSKILGKIEEVDRRVMRLESK